MTGIVQIYHSFLRGGALLVALVLLFDSGVLSPVTKSLSQNTQDYIANVIGVGAAVSPTELSTLTAELGKREQAIAERERELNIGLNDAVEKERVISTYILSVLLFIIIVLILLNYALDWLRERERVIEENHERTA